MTQVIECIKVHEPETKSVVELLALVQIESITTEPITDGAICSDAIIDCGFALINARHLKATLLEKD